MSVAGLDSWNDGPTKAAIVDFVGRAVDQVPVEERVAVFDNDGTLWVEKPAYIQLDFLVRRLAEQAAADPDLAAEQPYRAAAQGDLQWFGDAVTRHYNGDDSALKILAGGILSAYAGLAVEDHAEHVKAFFAGARHPQLNRPYTACGYAPMIELLRYLESNGFTNYIASGGGRDFMRPVTTQMYGIPPERVIGSSVGLDFADGHLKTTAVPEFLDDGPVKPVRIWGRVGRRPIFAAGNSNGDIEMLEYTTAGAGPSMSMLLRHDDAEREFDYTAGAEKALELAANRGWTVTSMRGDWSTVFSADA
ncbi:MULTISPECIES: HAD family hydrolase [Mycolicibacterium]|uniref:HAD family hydrolase n=1 Tax=Mycolicibacterium TaxID=1866885 RepID=UPI000688A2C7|nr:HAD family hydrolase [Mycolicibacterium mageritense]MBN3457304.1 haloacid dehalogenase-like hydrolase [Mycobacterium sp. DSM 3803]MCC9182487.1 haloacid dehalogenase-like hydrolase [Mycolicibacterium mageritense]TXH25591.1 MAG: haloacid dehalogenase-like hydrolase [Mycobacterium sp.]